MHMHRYYCAGGLIFVDGQGVESNLADILIYERKTAPRPPE
jgi:hypothetical protein